VHHRQHVVRQAARASSSMVQLAGSFFSFLVSGMVHEVIFW
jgi:hypothetical protein